jgi:hypothetical protein
VKVSNGEDAIVFYELAEKGFLTDLFAREVLGDDYNPLSNYYVKYCYLYPLVYYKNFVIAKTIYFQGFNGTPENEVIRKCDLSWGSKNKMITEITSASIGKLWKEKDFELYKYYHTHGCPQVVTEVSTQNPPYKWSSAESWKRVA